MLVPVVHPKSTDMGCSRDYRKIEQAKAQSAELQGKQYCKKLPVGDIWRTSVLHEWPRQAIPAGKADK